MKVTFYMHKNTKEPILLIQTCHWIGLFCEVMNYNQISFAIKPYFIGNSCIN